ncbi:MAG: ABC transporter ATP-binding protein [Chlamydiae bacterium]|nr:ABC transporter ATP-binding protein [Chlamydiota bacterium]
MILKAKNICKSFYTPEKIDILQNVSLEVKKNAAIAIVGASGEGKTTLLHIFGTLQSFDSGELIIGNTSDPLTLRNQKIGFVFQSYNLLEDLTALENVLMPAKIARKKVSSAHGIMLLKKVGLEKRAHFSAKLLSNGEKQRVALARALCNDPDLILADEPSGNLDHHNSKIIHQLLLDCAKSGNKSLIVVTHDKELAALCDKIFCLKEGTLTQVTSF